MFARMLRSDYDERRTSILSQEGSNVPKLSVLIPPQEDEILYSFFSRLSEANGLHSIAYFINGYLHIRRKSGHISGLVIPYDPLEYYSAFTESADTNEDWVQFYLDHTIYPGMAPFLRKELQTHTINLAFRDRHTFPGLIAPLSGEFRELHMCPECQKEDIAAHGFWYYHRQHQMPGVVVCPKHHVPLQKYTGRQNHELTDDSFEPLPADVSHRKGDAAYAEFAEAFLKADLQTDYMSLCEAIRRKIKSDDLTSKSYPLLDADFKKQGISHLFGESIEHLLKVSFSLRGYSNIPTCMALLMYLFDTPAELEQWLPSNADFDNEFFNAQKQGGYTLDSPYRRTIVQMRADNGESFTTTPFGFLEGWREPSRDIGKTDAQKYQEIFDNLAKGDYQLLTPFSGMQKKVKIRHLACGQVLDFTARSFLEDGRRCPCEYKVSQSEARQKIEANNGFRMVRFINTSEPVIIEHIDKGHTFACNYRDFLLNPYCRACHPAVRTDRSYREEVRDLVGNEYTVTGKYKDKDTRVEIRHNACGKTQMYFPRHFLNGQRCKYCTRAMSMSQFKRFVYDVSLGKYQVTGQKSRNLVTITNTETGEEQHLHRRFVVQEFLRPTPSSTLPLDKKGAYKKTKSSYDRLAEYIESHYSNTELIFAGDIRKAVGKKKFSNYKERLFREGVLYEPSPCIYCRSPRILTSEQVMEETFICRNGRRIGFVCGESLAYELGIIAEKPKIMRITSNLGNAKFRIRKAGGMEAYVKRSDYLVTDSSYRIIQVLDVIHYAHHYGWRPKSTQILKQFVRDHHLDEKDFQPYLRTEKDYVKREIQRLLTK